MAQKIPSGPPMDLACMRENGIRSVRGTCLKCQVARVVNMDGYDDSWAVTCSARACFAKPAEPGALT